MSSNVVPPTVEAVKAHRSGERTLSLLATPLNLFVLRVLSERPMRLAELRQATGLPAQTTLRGHLSSLEEIGALTKRPTERTPFAIENQLTPMGEELLDVATSLDTWLQRCPAGPISLESGAAKGVVRAFTDGWGSSISSVLATEPMSLTELDREIADFSYPALERRLSSMRMAGLIEARPGHGWGTPYALTDWARRGVRPLAAAVRCERVHMRGRAAPVTEADVEGALLLATPLANLSQSSSGVCRLHVEAAQGLARESGVRVEVNHGRVVACESGIDGDSASYAVGTTAKWLTAIKEGAIEELHFGGAGHLAEGLVRAMHVTLMKT